MDTSMRCALCPQPGHEMHHVTARELDPETMLPACKDHHPMFTDDWNTANVGPKRLPATPLHSLQIGLQRWGMFFGRLAAAAESPIESMICQVIADWLAKWAFNLKRMIEVFDEHFPGWADVLRNALPDLPGFVPPSGQS